MSFLWGLLYVWRNHQTATAKPEAKAMEVKGLSEGKEEATIFRISNARNASEESRSAIEMTGTSMLLMPQG